jgi:hypothetical protein
MCLNSLTPELLPKYKKAKHIGYKLVKDKTTSFYPFSNDLPTDYRTPFEASKISSVNFTKAISNIETVYNTDSSHREYRTGYHIYPTLKEAKFAVQYLKQKAWDVIIVKVEYKNLRLVGTDGTSGRDGEMTKLTNLVVDEIRVLSEVK